jgi:hypothetical protein
MSFASFWDEEAQRSGHKVFSLRFQMFLGGEDLRHYDFKRRLDECKVFAKAINKPSLPDYAVVRVKEQVSILHRNSKFRTRQSSKSC